MAKKAIKKKNSKKNPCAGCPAYCCHDLAMLIGRPYNKTDRMQIEWYLHFDTVSVFIRHHRWYLLIKGKCIYLGKDYKCTIYKDRSNRCRRHDPNECERYGNYYDTLINTPEELREYLSHTVKKSKNTLKGKILSE